MINEPNNITSQKKWINIYINGEVSQYNSSYNYKGMHILEHESPSFNVYDVAIFDNKIQLYKFNNSVYHLTSSKDFLISSFPITSLKEDSFFNLKDFFHYILPNIFSHPHIERSKLIAEALKEFIKLFIKKAKLSIMRFIPKHMEAEMTKEYSKIIYYTPKRKIFCSTSLKLLAKSLIF